MVLVIPILGGLGAALAFTVGTLASARASRLVGALSTLAGMMAIGLVVALPIALFASPPPDLGGGTLPWAALAGIANVTGLLLIFSAYRIGAVGIIATVVSTEGSIAAVLAVLAGEALAPGSGLAMALVAVGVLLAASGGGQEEEEGVRISRERSLRAAGLAITAAVCFGTGLYSTGHVSGLLPVAWAILPARVVGVVVVAIPLALARRVRISRAALPYVAVAGLAEIGGYASFVTGAREGIAIASVLSTMFAPMATVAAFVLFRERLGRREIAGIALVVAGIAVLGALQT
jgi:drug/metabolite transporter (DMT)-like permease